MNVFMYVPYGSSKFVFCNPMFPVTYLLMDDSDLPWTSKGRNDVQRCLAWRTFQIMSKKHTAMLMETLRFQICI